MAKDRATTPGRNHSHSTEAIRNRVNSSAGSGYARNAVLGAIDGGITTFAIVSGTLGAHFSTVVTIVLGFANLLADGFSMAVSEYQATRTEEEEIRNARDDEHEHITRFPDEERAEVEEIYRQKGFDESSLQQAVNATVKSREAWVNTMLTDELHLQSTTRNPFRAAATTFISFLLAGIIPLIPFLFPADSMPIRFRISTIMTGLLFLLIGYIKGTILKRKRFLSACETLLTGGLAALLAYGVGMISRNMIN